MKYLAPILIYVCLLGCDPPNRDATKPVPVASTEAQTAAFEELAAYVESGQCESGSKLVKVAGETLKRMNVKPPAGYDAALTPYMTPRPIDKVAAAKMLRGFK